MKRLGKKERAAKAVAKQQRQLRIRMARATVERWQDAGIVSIAAGRMRTKRVGTSPILTRSQVDIIAKVEAAKDAEDAKKGPWRKVGTFIHC